VSEEVAIYGITGALGHEVLQALEVDHEGIGGLVPVAGPSSAGRNVRWRGASLPVLGPADVDASVVDVAVFATRADVVTREAPRILQAGGRIIDASGVWARTRGAPVVWPRLARKAAVELDVESAVALPSPIGSTLAPLLEAVTVARAAGLPPLASCDVVAIMAASGAGRRGIDALSKQAVGLLSSQAVERGPFPRALAFDVLSEASAGELVVEERVQSDIAALVPDAGVRPNVAVLWAPAFSGLVLTVTLRFAADVDRAGQSLLQTVAAALASHPDVHLGGRDEDEAAGLDDDVDDGDV
jgi:aspartate-semialdehyde dehydrogenase